MIRLVTFRFETVLDPDECARVASEPPLSAFPDRITWASAPAFGRTYAQAPEQVDAAPRGGSATGATVVLEVAASSRARRAALELALGGRGRPAGIVDLALGERELLVELDDRVTPLAFVADVVDAVAEGAGLRSLFALADRSLAAFAATALANGDIDERRILESYVTP